MIVTKSWLEEYVEIADLSAQKIAGIFNAIGHEVASVTEYAMPENVVVGKVVSCEKHPDADKLNVCQVDTGDGIRQIVCGASNVREGLFVAAAVPGAVLPGNFEIKPAKLRGVESLGMICSSKELGLPAFHDGIMELDETVGDLVPGTPLAKMPFFNDTVIDVELTANRGDCLSIYGLARDLSAATDRNLRVRPCDFDDDNAKGIGRVLQLAQSEAVTGSTMFKVIANKGIKAGLRTGLRLALVEEEAQGELNQILKYSTHATGVILNAYSFDFFRSGGKEKGEIRLEKKEGINLVYGAEEAAKLGISRNKEAQAKDDDELIIIEASFVDPEEVSVTVQEGGLKSGDEYYRSSRGSEPDLELGVCHLCGVVKRSGEAEFYSEKVQYVTEQEQVTIHVSIDSINKLIGQEIDKNRIVTILKRLQCDVQVTPEQNNLIVRIPSFRHDLVNEADITEEIVRIVGIDNIAAKPLMMQEKHNLTPEYLAYRRERDTAKRAASAGFAETLHFVFTDKKKQAALGYPVVEKAREIANPITAELDTLRTSLLPNLLESARQNVHKSRKRVALFEIGQVFDANRDETRKIGLLWTGDGEGEQVANHGKPAPLDLYGFVRKLNALFPGMELEPATGETPALFHPNLQAAIVFNGQTAGRAAKLHPAVAGEYDLPDTFLCELDLEKARLPFDGAVATSKFQKATRDISVLLEKNVPFHEVRKTVLALGMDELKKVYAADYFEDEKLGSKASVTLRLVFQSGEGTMEDDAIQSACEKVLMLLKNEFGADQR